MDVCLVNEGQPLSSDVTISLPRDSVNTKTSLLSCANFASTNITKTMIVLLLNKGRGGGRSMINEDNRNGRYPMHDDNEVETQHCRVY